MAANALIELFADVNTNVDNGIYLDFGNFKYVESDL